MSLSTTTIQTKGLTFASLFKLNVICLSIPLGIFFILACIANIFIPYNVTTTAEGFKVTGAPGIGLIILSYPIFVLGFATFLSIFMYIGLRLYTRCKDIYLTLKIKD